MAQCPQCGAELPEGAALCPVCSGLGKTGQGEIVGQENMIAARPGDRDVTLKDLDPSELTICPHCGKGVSVKAQVCPNCGEPLSGAVPWLVPSCKVSSRMPRRLLGAGCGCLGLLVVFGIFGLIGFFTSPDKEKNPPPTTPATSHAPVEAPKRTPDSQSRSVEKAAGKKFTVLGNAYACQELEDYKSLARIESNGPAGRLGDELNMRIATGKCRIFPLGATVYVDAVSQADSAMGARLSGEDSIWWTSVRRLTP